MILHYLKIALRNLIKYKTQTLISVAGLVIGLVCFTYGLYWLDYETSYDGFYPQSKQIYVVYGIDKQTGRKMERLPLTLARKLEKDFPEVKATTMLYSQVLSTFHVNNKSVDDAIERFVDSKFFDFFPLPVICGKQKNMPETLNEIVVNRSFAEKHFGSADKALGQVISNGYRKSLTIVSVVEDAPVNSEFRFDIYELDEIDQQYELMYTGEDKWLNENNKIFILLEEKADPQKFEDKIAGYLSEHNYPVTFIPKVIPITASRHTFGSELTFNLSYIHTFAITGLLLLLCVFFNFTSLTLNRIYLRKREMKLRNAIGSGRKELAKQLLCELNILILIGFIIAYSLIEITAEPFSRFFETILVTKELNYKFFTISVISWLVLNLTCLPFIFRFINISSLISSPLVPLQREGLFRKISITTQLAVCIFFLTATCIMFQQIGFMKKKDLGFNKESLIQLTLNIGDRSPIIQEIASFPQFKEICPSAGFQILHSLERPKDVNWEGKPDNFSQDFHIIEVGSNFLKTFGVPLLQGRFTNDKDMVPGKWLPVCTKAVINEEAARIMGMRNPIGKTIRIESNSLYKTGSDDSQALEIVGIVKNFQTASLRNPILPVIILHNRDKLTSRTYYIQTPPEDKQAGIQKINEILKKHLKEGDEPSVVKSVTDILDELRRTEDASLQLFSLIAILCTLISVFGLYAVSSSNMEQRRKEIAIRKVAGATSKTIVYMFFREYIGIVLIANALALPLAWLFMHNWLMQYPYRAEIGAGMYITVILFTTALIIATVLYQTLRAARSNPADVIKSE